MNKQKRSWSSIQRLLFGLQIKSCTAQLFDISEAPQTVMQTDNPHTKLCNHLVHQCLCASKVHIVLRHEIAFAISGDALNEPFSSWTFKVLLDRRNMSKSSRKCNKKFSFSLCSSNLLFSMGDLSVMCQTFGEWIWDRNIEFRFRTVRKRFKVEGNRWIIEIDLNIYFVYPQTIKL